MLHFPHYLPTNVFQLGGADGGHLEAAHGPGVHTGV